MPDAPPVLPKNKNPPTLLEKLLKIREREPRTDWQATGTKGILWRPSSESNCGQRQYLHSSLQTENVTASRTLTKASGIGSSGIFFFFSFIWAVFCTNENQALGVMLFCVYNKTSLTQMQLIYNL